MCGDVTGCFTALFIIVAGRGQARTVTKTVPNESFFNFFSPPDRKPPGAPLWHSVSI